MTTIAYRDGVLAGDSRISEVGDEGGSLASNTVKVFQVPRGPHKGHVVGLAGNIGAAMRFLKWYKDPRRDEPPQDDSEDSGNEFEALLLRPDGVFTVDDHLALMPVADDYIAIGTGNSAAMAAMHCGKTAIDAIKIASRCDLYTGGPIVAYSLKGRVQ